MEPESDAPASRLTPERLAKIDAALDRRTRHFTLVLEDLKDPHNISAVLRSCEVFGFQDAHVVEAINPYRASKAVLRGCLKWLTVYRYKTREACWKRLVDSGYTIAVASPGGEVSLEHLDLGRPMAFYLGSESLGSHPDTLKNADVRFRIPQFGLTESLNVSVCAGVLMAHLSRWLRERGRENFTLSQEERRELRGEWIRRCVQGMEKVPPFVWEAAAH